MRDRLLMDNTITPRAGDGQELREAIASLKEISRVAAILGISAFAASMAELVIFLYLTYLALFGLRVFSALRLDYWRHKAAVPMAVLVCLAAISVFLLVIYDAIRRRGSAIFEEISDDLHGYSGSRAASHISDTEGVPLDARVVLRTFSRATDLPLVPGKFGRTVYFLVNIFLVFGALLLTLLVVG